MPREEQDLAAQLGQDIFDKATFIAALMQNEFEPDSHEDIEIENKNPHALKHELVTIGVSSRHYDAIDPARASDISITEEFSGILENGTYQTEHSIKLLLDHDYGQYLFWVDLDTGEMFVETARAKEVTSYYTDRYPAVGKRALESLTIVSDELLQAIVASE